MQLTDYLALKKQTVSDFAKESGLTVTRVWRHAHGRTRPDGKSVRIYEEYTKGAVTANDWVELELRQPGDGQSDEVEAAV